MINKDLGMVTAYAYAVSKGYAGTEDEFATLMASYADVGQTAVDAALAAKGSEDAAKASETAAASSATSASNSATTAATKASEAAQSATDAGTSATNAANSATAASGSASTASTKASEAAQSAANAANSATAAGTAKTDAEAAKTAAQTAQTAAETAQTAAETAQAAAEAAAQTLVIDPTLTQPNQAAEAKATGDAIDAVNVQLGAFSKDGTAANAKQLLTDKGITESVPYLFRRSGGDGADREFDTLVGGTVAWNQLAQATAKTGTATWDADTTTYFKNTNAIISASLDSTHVYFVMAKFSRTISGNNGIRLNLYVGASASGIYITLENNAPDGYTASVSKPTLSGSATGLVLNNYLWKRGFNAGDTVSFDDYFICDLTQMFGSTIANYIYDLEQATAGAGVAFFRSLFPADYYPYDSGSLKSVEGVSAHVTIGFNQFPVAPTFGVGSDYAFDKDKSVRVIANQQYAFRFDKISTATLWRLLIRVWDLDGNIITESSAQNVFSASTYGFYYNANNHGYITGSDSTTKSLTITFFKDYYVRFYFLSGNTTSSMTMEGACFNFSDPAKNGTYEPYQKHSYALDDSLTLRGIPKLTDGKLSFDGDTYAADGTVTRRYGVVDLGTLSWSKYEESRLDVGYVFSTYLGSNGLKPGSINMISPAYVTSQYLGLTAIINNMGSAVNHLLFTTIAGNAVYAVNGDYSTAESFKTAMSGVYLVYELATPTAETAEPFQSPQIVSADGTEEYITTGIVPVGHSTFYPENLRAKIEELPSNFSTLIAPTESAFVATQNYTTGALFIVNNVLYKATANIANGGTITPGTNCTATTLAEIISALA